MRELRRGEHVFGFRRERQVQTDVIACREQQFINSHHMTPLAAVDRDFSRARPVASTFKPQCQRFFAKWRADVSQPDDAQRLSFDPPQRWAGLQIVAAGLGFVVIESHFAGQRQQQRQRMLGHFDRGNNRAHW